MISLWVLEAKPLSLAFFVLASSGYAPGMRQRKKTNCEKARTKTRERTIDMEEVRTESEREREREREGRIDRSSGRKRKR